MGHGLEATSPASSGARKSAQSYACVVCSQRKVKCDRQSPCSNCVKGNVTCEYRVPPPAKRRKRKDIDEQETIDKLNRYEKILNDLGVDVDTPGERVAAEDDRPMKGDLQADVSKQSSPSRANGRSTEPGLIERDASSASAPYFKEYRVKGKAGEERMFVEGHKSRYTENNLWGSLSDNLLKAQDMLPAVWNLRAKPTDSGNSATELGPGTLLFGSHASYTEVKDCKPSLEHSQKMWRFFRNNVDPLLKMFDINVKETNILKTLPTFIETASTPSVYFAIFFCAITSLDDEECMKEFGESRATLLNRYQWATEQTLITARLLQTSDVFVLQALLMYLLCMRQRIDSGSLWILNGVAIRMAQRAGIHRDADYLDGDVWQWHAEMRRRLWWQIILLERHSAELSGFGKSSWSSLKWDTKRPRNVDDAEIVHGKNSFPPDRPGATDMIFCSILYEMNIFFRDLEADSGVASQSTVQQREAIIDELERRLEQKYLSYCDPLVPLHFLSSIVARSAFARMRFSANQPRRRADGREPQSQADKDKLFSLALKALEYDNLAHSTKSIRKFRFYIQNYFPWQQLIYILSELRTRTTGNDADRAWEQLEEAFEHRPDITTNGGTALHKALGNLTLRVWDARMKEFERQLPGIPLPKRPAFIEALQASRQQTEPDGAGPAETLKNEENSRPVPQNGVPESVPQDFKYMEEDAAMLPLGYPPGVNPYTSPADWFPWDDLAFQDLSFGTGLDGSMGFFGTGI